MASVTARHTLIMLVQRLKWPVPMVRWRAAREIRDLLQNSETRANIEDEILNFLESCTTESEVCAVLCLIFMTESKARPERDKVASKIQCPSILADAILEATFGAGAALGGWETAHSGECPSSFEPDKYFFDHNKAHIPPIFFNELHKIELSTGRPFTRQWAWEWHKLRERLETRLTSYAHYFDEYGDIRSGVKGQYLQRQTEVFRSSHIRTFALAVSEWGMPLKLARDYLVEHIPAVGGIFDLNPGPKPEALRGLPEKALSEASNLEILLSEWVKINRTVQMPAVSLDSPFPSDLVRYGDMSIGAYFVSADFEMKEDEGLFEPMDLTLITKSLSIEGMAREADIDNMTVNGESGRYISVCSSFFPLPFGFWSSDCFAMGLPVLAPHCLTGDCVTRVRAGALELISAGAVVARTRIWNDMWTPNYIAQGHTRCGAIAEVDKGVFGALLGHAPPGWKLAWYMKTRVWKRMTDYGEYSVEERSALILDEAA